MPFTASYPAPETTSEFPDDGESLLELLEEPLLELLEELLLELLEEPLLELLLDDDGQSQTGMPKFKR